MQLSFPFILWLLISFSFSFLGAYLISKRGFDLDLVDSPTKRSSHLIPVPKGGGIGILAAFVIGVIWWEIPYLIWIPVCIVSLISLLADYQDISYKIRLGVQVAAAAIVSIGTAFYDIKSFLWLFFGMLFITTTANYYNFMDGINGIAGVTGIIAFIGLGYFGLIENKDPIWSVTAFGVAVACMGFLPLNFPKARVFMGDVGSVLLGFLFACFVLYFSQTLIEFIVLTSLLFPFYADEISTLIFRIKDGDRLTKAHRRHIYQLLANQAGFSHSFVTIIYGFFQIIIALLAWMVSKEGIFWLVALLFFFFIIFFFFGFHIRNRWETEKKFS